MTARESMMIPPEWSGWEIVSEIGEGSFGKVYQIKKTDTAVSTVSAMKVIHIPVDEKFRKELLQTARTKEEQDIALQELVDQCADEIRVMYQLQGDTHIVSIQDHLIKKETDGEHYTIYIRMEYLTPLQDHVLDHTFLQKDVIKLGMDICMALKRCESLHMIHRDLKPDNIFVSPAGDYKLGDFGIARQMKEMYANYSQKGTMTYMAPEVYKGSKYGSNADIYSLGMILYKFLNYNLEPFLSRKKQIITYKDKEEAFQKRMSGEELPLPAQASPTLAKVILKACAYHPGKRYQTAEELMRDLAQCSRPQKAQNTQNAQNTVRPAESAERKTSNTAKANGNREEIHLRQKSQTAATGRTQSRKKKKPVIALVAAGALIAAGAVLVPKVLQPVKTVDVADSGDTVETISLELPVTKEMEEAAAAFKEIVYNAQEENNDVSDYFLMPEYANISRYYEFFGSNDEWDVEVIPLAADKEDGCLLNVIFYRKDNTQGWLQSPAHYRDILQMQKADGKWKINNKADVQQARSYVSLMNTLSDYEPEGYRAAQRAGRFWYYFKDCFYMYLGRGYVYSGRKTCEPLFMWEEEDGTIYVAMLYTNGQSETIVQNRVSANFVNSDNEVCLKLKCDLKLSLKPGENQLAVYPLETITYTNCNNLQMTDFTCE